MNDEITLKSAVDDFAAQGLHSIFLNSVLLWFQQPSILLLISFSPF